MTSQAASIAQTVFFRRQESERFMIMWQYDQFIEKAQREMSFAQRVIENQVLDKKILERTIHSWLDCCIKPVPENS